MHGDEVRAIRGVGQRLDALRGHASASDLVRHLVAVQAQDMAAAALGVAVRSDNLSVAAVNAARNEERSIVRLWCLRGTLHLVAAPDVHWMLELVRPRLKAANRRRRAELGLDDGDTERGVRVVAQSLEADGPLTRAQIAERLRRHGIASQGQATIHVIWRAAIDGLACYGPDHLGEETFVTLDNWVAVEKRMTPPRPVLELARRYLAAYGPATREDFRAWSGLSRGDVTDAWNALQTETITVSTPFGEMLLIEPRAESADAMVRLLPSFDGVWVGYGDHEVFLDPQYHRRVFPGGGIIRPLVFANGRIVGTWSRRAARQRVDVSVDLFEPVDLDMLAAAVVDYGRAMGRTGRLVQPAG